MTDASCMLFQAENSRTSIIKRSWINLAVFCCKYFYLNAAVWTFVMRSFSLSLRTDLQITEINRVSCLLQQAVNQIYNMHIQLLSPVFIVLWIWISLTLCVLAWNLFLRMIFPTNFTVGWMSQTRNLENLMEQGWEKGDCQKKIAYLLLFFSSFVFIHTGKNWFLEA